MSHQRTVYETLQSLPREAQALMLANFARMHSSDLVAIAIKSTSEFQMFLDTCKAMGIAADYHWMPWLGDAGKHDAAKEAMLRKWMAANGFNLTPLATNGVICGPLWHFFFVGGANLEGVAGGAYMFTWNKATGEFTKHPTRTITCTE